jgi:hypothetical protein
VLIQRGNPKQLDWENLIDAVLEYVHEFDIEMDFTDVVTFNIFSKKDLSPLATKILPFLIKPSKHTLSKPANTKAILFLRLPSDKTVLEIKEEQAIKRGRVLSTVVWHCMKYLRVKASTMTFNFKDSAGRTCVAKRVFPDIPTYLVQNIDWSSAVKYKKKELPIYLKLEKSLPLFSRTTESALLEVEGFPYFSDKRYFGLGNFEFSKHSLIIGQTGVGKSKFISLFVNQIASRGLMDQYSIVVIDPHASLYSDLLNIPKNVNIDFRETAAELFGGKTEPKIAAELTIMLFKTLLVEQFNGKMEQVLKYALFALLSVGKMSLPNLKEFLTDMNYRKNILNELDSTSINKFFDTEYVEINTKFYETAIMPVLTLLDELNFLPTFSKEKSLPLENQLKQNFLTVFSLSRIFLGDRATKLIAGLLIQQIFLIAQGGSIKKKLILIVDEVPVVENNALVTILSEARKFNLSLYLSMQYLSQVSPELLKGVLANNYNYFVFKTTEEDAKLLVKNLLIEIPDEVIKGWADIESQDDLKLKLLTSLDVRECITRAYYNNQFYPVFKGRTMDTR